MGILYSNKNINSSRSAEDGAIICSYKDKNGLSIMIKYLETNRGKDVYVVVPREDLDTLSLLYDISVKYIIQNLTLSMIPNCKQMNYKLELEEYTEDNSILGFNKLAKIIDGNKVISTPCKISIERNNPDFDCSIVLLQNNEVTENYKRFFDKFCSENRIAPFVLLTDMNSVDCSEIVEYIVKINY